MAVAIVVVAVLAVVESDASRQKKARTLTCDSPDLVPLVASRWWREHHLECIVTAIHGDSTQSEYSVQSLRLRDSPDFRRACLDRQPLLGDDPLPLTTSSACQQTLQGGIAVPTFLLLLDRPAGTKSSLRIPGSSGMQQISPASTVSVRRAGFCSSRTSHESVR